MGQHQLPQPSTPSASSRATKTTFEKTDDKDNAPGKEVGLDKSDPKAIDFLLFDDTDER